MFPIDRVLHACRCCTFCKILHGSGVCVTKQNELKPALHSNVGAGHRCRGRRRGVQALGVQAIGVQAVGVQAIGVYIGVSWAFETINCIHHLFSANCRCNLHILLQSREPQKQMTDAHVCMYVYMYVCVCVCVCAFVIAAYVHTRTLAQTHTYTHTHAHTHTHTYG